MANMTMSIVEFLLSSERLIIGFFTKINKCFIYGVLHSNKLQTFSFQSKSLHFFPYEMLLTKQKIYPKICLINFFFVIKYASLY